MKVLNGIITAVFVTIFFFLMILTAQAGSPDIKAAKMHTQAMVEEGERMIGHGNLGHLDMMIEQAEAMMKHAKEALEAIPSNNTHGKEAVDHIKEGIGHLEEAIARGRKGNLDAAMAHAHKAMAHAKQGNLHAQGM